MRYIQYFRYVLKMRELRLDRVAGRPAESVTCSTRAGAGGDCAPVEYAIIIRFEEVGVMCQGQLDVAVAPYRGTCTSGIQPLGLQTESPVPRLRRCE